MIHTLTLGGLAFAAYRAGLSALIAHRRRSAFWPVFRRGLALHAELAIGAAAKAGRGPRAYVGLTRTARGRIRAWEGLSWRL